MFKANNTYYNFQNDMPEALTSNVTLPTKNNPASQSPTKSSGSKPTTEFDKAISNIRSGGNWKSIFDISGNGTKYALLGAGVGLGYALYNHKPWIVYTALAGVFGIASYNIYHIIKPLNTSTDGK